MMSTGLSTDHFYCLFAEKCTHRGKDWQHAKPQDDVLLMQAMWQLLPVNMAAEMTSKRLNDAHALLRSAARPGVTSD